MSTNFADHFALSLAPDIQVIPWYVPMFECGQDKVSIAYSLVCDFKPECDDLSDEYFCHHITCPDDRCENEQCLLYKNRCDRIQHCFDGSDEVRVYLPQ